MTDKLRFSWIDDSPGRKSVASNLEAVIDAKINYVDVYGQELEEKIKELVGGEEPHLIIVDHKLQDISDGYFKTGSTAATIIRESWPGCPIVCVSGVGQSEFKLEQKDIYEAIFPVENISKHYSTIHSIATSYLRYRTNTPKNIDEVVVLLDDALEEEERLKSIMPPEIKNNILDESVIRHISNWIRGVLFERPGFLYDRLWASTFLGINENGFNKVESLFVKARYNGLFADDSKPRWWKNKLLSILSENVQENGLPWEKGRSLPGLTDDDFSFCYVTKEPFPETVAFLDEKHEERQPMKLKETIPDESFQDLLYFEELRIMNPA